MVQLHDCSIWLIQCLGDDSFGTIWYGRVIVTSIEVRNWSIWNKQYLGEDSFGRVRFGPVEIEV